MNYEDVTKDLNKYSYIIVTGRKAGTLGQSNELEIAKQIAENVIKKKNGKFENMFVSELVLEIIPEKLIKLNNESKIKTIGGPIQIKIFFNRVIEGRIIRIDNCYKNNNIFITDRFLQNKIFDEKVMKIIASAAFNNILKKELFILNKIDDLIKF